MEDGVLAYAITGLVLLDAWACIRILLSHEMLGRKLLQMAFVLLLPVVGAAIMIGLHRVDKRVVLEPPPYSNERDGIVGIQGSFHHDGS